MRRPFRFVFRRSLAHGSDSLGQYVLKAKQLRLKLRGCLNDATVDMLKAHAETQFYRLKYYDVEQTADTPVLCGSLGEDYRPSKLTSDYIAFTRNCGFDVTFHELRHTHASLLLKHGASIQYVSQRLGHENIAITYKFYAHFLPGDDGGSAEAWGEVAYIGGDAYAGLPPAA